MEYSPLGLSAGSLNTNRPQNGVDFGIKARNRGQDLDDCSSIKSGSIASMTSSSKPVTCRVCRDPEVLPSKPFVKCTQCRKIWHQGCHTNPDLDCTKPPLPGFICGSCTKKAVSSPASNSKHFPTSYSTTPAPRESTEHGSTPRGWQSPQQVAPTSQALPINEALSNKSTPQKKPGTNNLGYIPCAISGCDGLASSSSLSKNLCVKHSMYEKHARAKAQPAPPAAPVSKPFRKEKLHPVRPDDRVYLKRKRPDMSNRKASTDMHTNGSKPAAAKNTSSAYSAPPNRMPRPQEQSVKSTFTPSLARNHDHGRDYSLGLKNMTSMPPADQGSPSLSTTSLAQLQKDHDESTKLGPSKLTEYLDSQRPSPVLRNHDSPEYEPPPPQDTDLTDLWSQADEEGDSPGSQIAQELRANAEEAHHSNAPSSMLSPVGEQTPIPTRIENSGFVMVREGEEFFSHGALDPTLENASSPKNNRTRRAPSPLETTISPHLRSDARPDIDMVMDHDQSHNIREELDNGDMDEGWTSTNHPQTCLEQRLASGPYDESELDFFLQKQSNRDDSYRPTKADLDAQNWGYIDPRVVWAEDLSNQQIAAKKQEIQERGGRKANLGKIFTDLKLQEQEEQGWGIHQSSDTKDDDQTMQTIKHLEELFGVENLANLVPATRNGRLVMIDREPLPEDGNGKKKKKSERRIFTVNGAPNTI